jgi:hypothetical protein
LTRPNREPSVALALYLLALLAALVMLHFYACGPRDLGALNDETHRRDTLCAFAEAWAPHNPELEPLNLACDRRRPLSELTCLLPGLWLDTGRPPVDTSPSSDP